MWQINFRPNWRKKDKNLNIKQRFFRVMIVSYGKHCMRMGTEETAEEIQNDYDYFYGIFVQTKT